MAKRSKTVVAEPEVNTAEWLEQKMAKMKDTRRSSQHTPRTG